MVPESPAASVAGQPGAIVSPGLAPFSGNVNSAHADCGIAPKLKDADPIRNAGSVLPPVAFTEHEPDCAEGKLTVNVFALVKATDFGRIHNGGVLVSKQANTTLVEFKLCASVTEVALVNACWKFGIAPAPFAFTTHEPDCAAAKLTVKVFALVRTTDFGRIHSGGVLLSKQAKTIPVEFRL